MQYDDDMLHLPVMNFGHEEPVTNADDDMLRMPVMNFGCGCDSGRDTATATAKHPSPKATANVATGGDDGDLLPLPSTL